eukprot:3579510-Prymnesium_polylepis.2
MAGTRDVSSADCMSWCRVCSVQAAVCAAVEGRYGAAGRCVNTAQARVGKSRFQIPPRNA